MALDPHLINPNHHLPRATQKKSTAILAWPLWTEGRVTTKLGLHAKGGTGNFDVAGCRWLNAGLGKVLGRPPTSESQRSPGTPITLDDNNKLRYYS